MTRQTAAFTLTLILVAVAVAVAVGTLSQVLVPTYETVPRAVFDALASGLATGVLIFVYHLMFHGRPRNHHEQ